MLNNRAGVLGDGSGGDDLVVSCSTESVVKVLYNAAGTGCENIAVAPQGNESGPSTILGRFEAFLDSRKFQ